MTKKSAGILLYKYSDGTIKFFLVHPGGPLWSKKDEGFWSVPKGEIEDEESSEAAKREFFEETGYHITGDLIPLTPRKLKSGKLVIAFATNQDIDSNNVRSNLFELEWPPKSGKYKSFPEIDRGEWFTIDQALKKINAQQAGFIIELMDILNNR